MTHRRDSGLMRALTLVLPYYDNPGMLRVQQAAWVDYAPTDRASLHVIIVDDASPRWPAQAVGTPAAALASYRLYRIGVDVRWNWLACRNLGVTEASTDWVLLTDIDHVVPADTLHWVLHAPLDPETVYRFSRVTAPDDTPYKPHPNSWLLTRALFDRIGGYDERFSGYYGTDSEFRARATHTARAVHLLPHVLVRYPREVVPDASTTTYGRKEPQDRMVRHIRKARDREPGWRPLRGTFPWTRVI